MSSAVVPLAFRVLVYRYFFYGWLFQDASSGSVWQRNAALVHNREQAKWLPTYMRRGWVFAGMLFLLAWVLEVPLESPVLSAFLYVPLALTFPYNVVTGICYLALTSIGSQGH